MLTVRPSRSRGWLLALFVLAVAHAVAYPALADGYSFREVLFYLVPGMVATVVVGSRIRRSAGFERASWAVLFAAVAGALTLDTAWNLDAHFNGEAGYPSWWDVPYLFSYLLYAAGLGLLVSPVFRSDDRKWLFDVAALMALSAGLAWHFIVPHTSNLEDVTGTAYLAFDGLYLAIALTAITAARVTLRNITLAFAALAFAAGDLLYYIETLAYDSSWVVGSWLIAIAAAMPQEREVRLRWPAIFRAWWLPYALVSSVAVVAAFEMSRGHIEDLLLAGVVSLALIVTRQVVALRQSLSAERQATAFREAVLETQSHLGLGMVILEDGRVTFVNGAAERIFGRTADELLQLESIGMLAGAEQRRAWLEWAGAPASPEEARVVRPDGVVAEIEVVGRNLQVTPEDKTRTLIVARDVTERRQTAAAIAHAQKLEGLGALAGGVAHDFNNLLSVVIGNAALLKLGELDDDARETLEQIETAAMRGAELTRTLLDFARAQPDEFAVADLRECLGETVQLARPGLPVNVALEVETGDEPLPVSMSRGQLVQAFLNIILNARDAIGEAGRITVCARRAAEFALVEISDTGPGMDRATQERIFEPFFTTKTAGAGTGLGLAIAQRAVREHGGTLQVGSAPGAGATFWARLPLAGVRRTP